jgi:ClpP class serine protease
MLESYIEHTYEDFVSKVDAGRKNLSYEEVHALAQGRVWTGEQAKKNGLIDDLGGLDVAMDHMREVSNISGAIRLVDATSSREGINVQFDSKPLMSILGMDTLETISEDYIKVFELWQDFAGEDALMLSPINPEEQQF